MRPAYRERQRNLTAHHCRTFLSARPPVHFGDHELTGTKKGFPKPQIVRIFRIWTPKCAISPQSRVIIQGNVGLCLISSKSEPIRPKRPNIGARRKILTQKPKLVPIPLPYGENETQWLDSFRFLFKFRKWRNSFFLAFQMCCRKFQVHTNASPNHTLFVLILLNTIHSNRDINKVWLGRKLTQQK